MRHDCGGVRHVCCPARKNGIAGRAVYNGLSYSPTAMCMHGCWLQTLCEGDRFDKLIRRAFQTCDELLFKVVRNLSQQDNINVKRRYGPYVEQCVTLLQVRCRCCVLCRPQGAGAEQRRGQARDDGVQGGGAAANAGLDAQAREQRPSSRAIMCVRLPQVFSVSASAVSMLHPHLWPGMVWCGVCVLRMRRAAQRHCPPGPAVPHAQAPDITAELFVEVLGTLANLYIPEFDFLNLVRKHSLLPFLATYAQVRRGLGMRMGGGGMSEKQQRQRLHAGAACHAWSLACTCSDDMPRRPRGPRNKPGS